MPKVTVNAAGEIRAVRTKAELSAYYAAQIEKRLQAMLVLQALGGDITPLRSKIQQLNAEKKQKLAGVD